MGKVAIIALCVFACVEEGVITTCVIIAGVDKGNKAKNCQKCQLDVLNLKPLGYIGRLNEACGKCDSDCKCKLSPAQG